MASCHRGGSAPRMRQRRSRIAAAAMPYLWMFFIFCMLGTLALCVMM